MQIKDKLDQIRLPAPQCPRCKEQLRYDRLFDEEGDDKGSSVFVCWKCGGIWRVTKSSHE